MKKVKMTTDDEIRERYVWLGNVRLRAHHIYYARFETTRNRRVADLKLEISYRIISMMGERYVTMANQAKGGASCGGD